MFTLVMAALMIGSALTYNDLIGKTAKRGSASSAQNSQSVPDSPATDPQADSGDAPF